MSRTSCTLTKLSTIAVLAIAANAQAHTLDLSINDDAVAIDYSTQLPKSELNLGFGNLHHKDDGDAFYASLFVADNVNNESGLLAGLGGRAYYLDSDVANANGRALGLGGFLNWDIPSVPNLSLRGDVYFAPDVLTWGDIDNFIDFSARVQYRIIEQAWVYAGYRRAMLETEAGVDENIDEGAFIGMMLWF